MNRVKKFFSRNESLVICLMLILCLVGCSSKPKDDGRNEEVIEENNSEVSAEDEAREISFNGDVVISQDLILILNSDGTVWGKGSNVLGQLGNGRREDAYEWTQVSDLENITGIYAGIKYGTGQEGNGDGYCYAFDKNKNLYRWGGYIFNPEIVDIIPNIEEVNKYDGGEMTIKTQDNKRFFMTNQYADRVWDNIFIQYESDAEKDVILGNAILRDNELTFFHMPLVQELSPQEYPTICDSKLEDWINGFPEEVVNIENVESVYGDFFVSSDVGNVCEMQEDGTVRDYGGSGLKKYVKNGNLELELFEVGKLCTKGDNRYGQLGDGTREDLESKFYEVTEAKFKDFVTDGDFVAAIDYDNNLWAWGEGYGDPQIVVSYEEFLSVTSTGDEE